MSRTTPRLTCVLLVSRDERVGQDLTSRLKGQDCAVWCVEALDVAREYMAQLLPDVLFLDTSLPEDLEGFMAGMRADADLADVPVLLLERDEGRVDEASARSIGARGVMKLPLHPGVLRRRVAAAASWSVGDARRSRHLESVRSEWRRLELMGEPDEQPAREPARRTKQRTPA